MRGAKPHFCKDFLLPCSVRKKTTMATEIATVELELDPPLTLTQFCPPESDGLIPRVALNVNNGSAGLVLSRRDAQRLAYQLTEWVRAIDGRPSEGGS